MELDCAVLVACQLNRASANDSNSEPRLTSLRDSGDIEQDADKVIFIHRPDTDPDHCDAPQADTSSASEVPSFFVNLIQAKGRDDGTGIKSFRFHRQTASFVPRGEATAPRFSTTAKHGRN
jgi:replicative DNA helicase